MKEKEFAEWMESLNVEGRIRALAGIYSKLTVLSRELFLRQWTAKNVGRAQEILHGLNEVHHTLANFLQCYATDPEEAMPTSVLAKQLSQIESQYHLEKFMAQAIELTRDWVSRWRSSNEREMD